MGDSENAARIGGGADSDLRRRAEGEGVVGLEAGGAGPERGAAGLVERVRVRVGAVALCNFRPSVRRLLYNLKEWDTH